MSSQVLDWDGFYVSSRATNSEVATALFTDDPLVIRSAERLQCPMARRL